IQHTRFGEVILHQIHGTRAEAFGASDGRSHELESLVGGVATQEEAEDAKQVELELRHLPRPVRFWWSSWWRGRSGRWVSVPCALLCSVTVGRGTGFFRFHPFHKPTAFAAGKPFTLMPSRSTRISSVFFCRHCSS